jgi:hypothetical protein
MKDQLRILLLFLRFYLEVFKFGIDSLGKCPTGIKAKDKVL